jgi:hypothetical protein
MEEVIQMIPKKVTEQMNEDLLRPIKEEEEEVKSTSSKCFRRRPRAGRFPGPLFPNTLGNLRGGSNLSSLASA